MKLSMLVLLVTMIALFSHLYDPRRTLRTEKR
jgi:hypothetical protein